MALANQNQFSFSPGGIPGVFEYGSRFAAVIQGNPIPQARMRVNFHQRVVFDPQRREKEAMGAACLDAVNYAIASITDTIPDGPIFPQATSLFVMLIFHVKRPQSHFNSHGGSTRAIRSFGNLRGTARMANLASIPGDVDNYIKFAFDAMNGIVFPDDRQVSATVGCKVFDDSSDCSGKTTIYIQAVPDAYDELELLRLTKEACDWAFWAIDGAEPIEV